ncbi:UbiA family prenyltransferase [Nocardioides scoriae]|nr:UbiA family prenyltransferase [Nocardioides scoriae]
MSTPSTGTDGDTDSSGGTRQRTVRPSDKPARTPPPRPGSPGSAARTPGEPPRTSLVGQLRAVVSAMHPRQALAFGVAVAVLVALMGRPPREWLVSGAAVLVVQLALGLIDDLVDTEEDRQTQAPGKPLASGLVPRGNATYALAVLVLLAVPLSLQNGLVAGALLLASLVVGVVHDRWLHRGLLSWVGWAATFALLAGFVSFGGWGREAEGTAPVTSFVVLVAVLGVLVHVLVALPDLVTDHRGTVRHLPLRIALRTGTPRLLLATAALTALVLAGCAYVALTAGIAR